MATRSAQTATRQPRRAAAAKSPQTATRQPRRAAAVMKSSESTNGHRKQAIINAGISEFSDKGFAGARINTIARKAKVNKQLIYYYFDSKVGLYEAALGHLITRWDERMAAGDPHPSVSEAVKAQTDRLTRSRRYRNGSGSGSGRRCRQRLTAATSNGHGYGHVGSPCSSMPRKPARSARTTIRKWLRWR